jgi:hypothetical protein
MMRNRGLNRIQKYDTALFIIINNGPHPRWLNTFFQQLSVVYNGGWAWIIGVALFWPFRRTRPEATRVLKGISVPIWVAALIVEGPIKKYFRRRRPFMWCAPSSWGRSRATGLSHRGTPPPPSVGRG